MKKLFESHPTEYLVGLRNCVLIEPLHHVHQGTFMFPDEQLEIKSPRSIGRYPGTRGLIFRGKQPWGFQNGLSFHLCFEEKHWVGEQRNCYWDDLVSNKCCPLVACLYTRRLEANRSHLNFDEFFLGIWRRIRSTIR